MVSANRANEAPEKSKAHHVVRNRQYLSLQVFVEGFPCQGGPTFATLSLPGICDAASLDSLKNSKHHLFTKADVEEHENRSAHAHTLQR